MSKTQQIEIDKLNLDLNNFRTTPQVSEQGAIKAMITIRPERFFAVMDSIIDDGYLHTENIIVLQDGAKLIVKEGNRRIGALKLIYGQYPLDDYLIPESLKSKITSINSEWKLENLKVPCSIYEKSDAKKVDKIISLTHGKGEKASRYRWTSVATARHNRDINKASEPVLDLLEKYIINGQNINNQQKERWAGDYPLTVLIEAINKIITRFEVKNSSELARNYPKIKYRFELEELMRLIGLELISFPKIRDSKIDFAFELGIIPKIITIIPNPISTKVTELNNDPSSQPTVSSNNTDLSFIQDANFILPPPPSSTSTVPPSSTSSTRNLSAKIAIATTDPRNVRSILNKFIPRGDKREKVVTLRDELKQLNIEKNPIAFCFLLRSMFELSAKAYASENSISLINSKGHERTLVELLTVITNHLTTNNSNKAKGKVLYGAITELGSPNGILSVKSMNQLVHNPSFSVTSSSICTMFGNIFPLLEEMN